MRILLLQAGFNELGIIEWFHEAGHYVVAIGNQVGLIGQKYVDEYICQDYSKVDEVLRLALDKKIDKVCACCNDTAVLTAVYVAEKLGLDGYDTILSAKTIAHKDLFKRFTKENNITSVLSEDFSDVKKAKEYAKNIKEYPVIVKPVDLSGGKGIQRCDTVQQLYSAIDNAFDMSRNKNVVIEPYVQGTQHGFCAFLHKQKVVACSSNDEISVINPYRVEIDMFPATNIEKYKKNLIEQVERMASKLKLVDGIFHLQYIMTNDGIYIIEAMRRIIGNMYSVPASKVSGFDWDAYEAQALIGSRIDNIEEHINEQGYYAYRALIAPKDGILESVLIAPEVEKYIFDRIILEKPGAEINNYKASTIGILFFEFSSREEMNKIMIEQYDKIRVEMK